LEFAQLDPDSAAAFRVEYGAPPALAPQVVRACYQAVDLISFFTVGEQEVRAWPIPRGAKAPEAAGAVHSDMEQGFIKAEVGHWEDVIEHGGFAALRPHGKLRLEGREYVVQDGDVVVFRFSR
jgi:ribosome-binding ATPase YchF (GTP1/OBG family)